MKPLLLCLALLASACSPEAERTRGGGPGGDTGNRVEIVRMHEGSRPFHDTVRRMPHSPPALDTASQARGFGQR